MIGSQQTFLCGRPGIQVLGIIFNHWRNMGRARVTVLIEKLRPDVLYVVINRADQNVRCFFRIKDTVRLESETALS